jgi:hypothetical protein
MESWQVKNLGEKSGPEGRNSHLATDWDLPVTETDS